MDDAERLLSIIRAAPLPFDKNDSQLAQEYRNWYYGERSDKLKVSEFTTILDTRLDTTDIPDAFDLRPLSSERITLKMRELKPAQFYYVKDIDDEPDR